MAITTRGSVTTRGRVVYNTPSIVTDGLQLYLDAGNIKSYSGSGATINDLSTRKDTATLQGTYSFSNNSIRLTNTNANGDLNVSLIQCNSITNITTVSLWYRVESTSAVRYLLDMRDGGAGGFILSSEAAGSNWDNGTLYRNGGSSQTITWANIEPTTGVWQNITVIADTPASDDINLFSRFSDQESYDVTFGAALIYNRVISDSENKTNFAALRKRFGI